MMDAKIAEIRSLGSTSNHSHASPTNLGKRSNHSTGSMMSKPSSLSGKNRARSADGYSSPRSLSPPRNRGRSSTNSPIHSPSKARSMSPLRTRGRSTEECNNASPNRRSVSPQPIKRKKKKRVLPNRQHNKSFCSASTLSSVGEDYFDTEDTSVLSWDEDLSEGLSKSNHSQASSLVLEELQFDELHIGGSHNKSHRSTLSDDSFHDSFSIGASLGSGAFGNVNRCHMIIGRDKSDRNANAKDSDGDDASQKSFAVKSVAAEHYNPQEIEILQNYLLDCPTVVKVTNVFHERKESYIVMEEMKGGDLLQRIAKRLCYKEAPAKKVFYTLLETIQYCHSKNVAHCDIKPENIMLVSKESDTDMKLTDFGMAKIFVDPDTQLKFNMLEMEGSAEYAAPEVFNRPEDDDIGYDERCDIWSCGVCLYVILAGYAPFEANTADEMIETVGIGKFKFHKRYWKNISKEAKILIVQLMQVDPAKRCSLEEALLSPWFIEEDELDNDEEE